MKEGGKQLIYQPNKIDCAECQHSIDIDEKRRRCLIYNAILYRLASSRVRPTLRCQRTYCKDFEKKKEK